MHRSRCANLVMFNAEMSKLFHILTDCDFVRVCVGGGVGGGVGVWGGGGVGGGVGVGVGWGWGGGGVGGVGGGVWCGGVVTTNVLRALQNILFKICILLKSHFLREIQAEIKFSA